MLELSGQSKALADMNDFHYKLITCKTVGEELEELALEGIETVFLEFGLHDYPQQLKKTLQKEIDRTGEVDAILLGYGLCSMSTLGLSSPRSRLVVPRMHDCIGIFMGSGREYLEQIRSEPGTYYLTKGWINHGGDPLKEFIKWQKKYGTDKARLFLEKTIGNYTRLAFIQTGKQEHTDDIKYARKVARKLDLKFEKITGNRTIVEKLISGCWDDDFIVVEPGDKVSLDPFYQE